VDNAPTGAQHRFLAINDQREKPTEAGSLTSNLRGGHLAQRVSDQIALAMGFRVIKSLLQWDEVSGDDTSDAVSNFTPGTLADGTYNFTAAAVDTSGTTSAASAPVVVTADTAAQSSVTVNAAPPLTVADGATVEIDGASGQSVTFAGTTGTLKLDDALAFTGQVSGLAGSDALDLADVSYGANTTATFLGNANGGTLTVSDGTQTANIALVGNYLSSNWDLSGDGNGGTIVVDPTSTNTWQTLPIGAGGYITGIDIAPNDTTVIRTDTYGAYIWNGTDWQQLITATSMPAAFVKTQDSQGVYEIQIAPSNSDIMYMMYEGYVFKSTNEGTTWTETSFAPVTENPNDAYRMDGQKMAIDPENPNIVYVGTPQNGLFVTTNGGTTWQSVSTMPVSLTDSNGIYPGITGIEFDPALGVTGGQTNTIFAASHGHGVYESTNGGASWSAIGGPSDVEYAAVSSTGVYYAVEGSTSVANGQSGNSLWSYQNGAWTELLSDTSGIHTVAVDPFNPNEIVIQTQSGLLNISYNGGESWSGNDSNSQYSSTNIPWLASIGPYLGSAGAVFDQLVPNELWISDAVGVWNTTDLPTQGFATNTPVVWNDQSLGIEQLVANEIVVPPGGDPVLASWDRPFFYINNLNAYPSTYGPVDSGTIVAGWSIDYASSDPSFLAGIADEWGVEESGYSTNGGQTWTPFPSFIPGAGTEFIGGTIAASSPTDIIWAPAGGVDPYYTLNGGATWNPITLPGISNWSGFGGTFGNDAITVTADRVLPDTFYLYYAGVGLYESTNGGVAWTQVYAGNISGFTDTGEELQSVPGEAGNLFFAQTYGKLYGSTNGGSSWKAAPNVTDVNCFGFGAPAPGQSYPSIYIVGWVNNVYGIWQSINDAQSWTQIGTYPTGDLDNIKTISGDPNIYGQVYVGFSGSGYASFTADPAVTGVAASPSSGVEVPGNTVKLTLTMSEAVTVTGTPTLSLNDGGTATYTGGSGTDGLTFSYTVSTKDSDVSALGITQVNEPNGATIKDANGNAANMAGAVTTISGLKIDPPLTVSSVVATGKGITNGSGDLNAGHVVTLTVNLSGAATVNGTPTLTLNDGGTATYTGGSGSNALTFGYTVAAGQNTPDLAVTAVNLGTATVIDALGNAANLAGAVTNPPGTLQIEATAPTVKTVTVAPTSNDVETGGTVTTTLTMSEIVDVTGAPALALNDGESATYVRGSGTTTLVFSYSVQAWDHVTSLQLTGTVSGGSIKDLAGNAAVIAPTNLELRINTHEWTKAVSANWSTTADWSSPAGVPESHDLVVLDAVGTYTVTVTASETIAELNTIATATLAIADGTFTITGGTGTGVQAGTVSIAKGATLYLSGDVINSGIFLANGGALHISVSGEITGGTTEIGGAGAVFINNASSENVAFLAGSTGKLVLEKATSYTGEISGFGANTSQSIDLTDLNFAAGAKIVSYVPNSGDTSGVLTITDGTNTAKLQLEGTYTLANFNIGTDGSGGTLLTDPPVVTQQPGNAPASIASGTVLEINTPDNGMVTFAGSTGTLWLDHPATFTGTVSGFKGQDVIDLPGIAFGAGTTLGYLPNSTQTGGTLSVADGALSAKIALLGNYIASNFALASDNHGGTMVVTEASHVATQSLLTNPHHDWIPTVLG